MGFSLKRIWQAYAFEHPQFSQRIDAPGDQSRQLTAVIVNSMQQVQRARRRILQTRFAAVVSSSLCWFQEDAQFDRHTQWTDFCEINFSSFKTQCHLSSVWLSSFFIEQ